MSCLNCGKPSKTRSQLKYCSNKCQADFNYKNFIIAWKAGKKIVTKNISGYLKRYIKIKTGEKCFLCGWNKRNCVTGKVPLEIDHIDGNSENNIESNLRLICPNCHALTPHFRNLNKGNGRKWRMKKYIRNK